MPGVIIDDSQLSQSSLNGRQWQLRTEQDGAYNRTVTVCDTASNGTGTGSTTPPSIQYSFYGTQINLVGRATADLRMNYTIDGSSVRPAEVNTSQSAVGKDGVVIWSLDRLEPTRHSIQILPVAGTLVLDYLSYLPSSTSATSQDTVVADNLDPQIRYSGTWNNDRDFSTPVGSPLNSTVSRTTTAGSSFQFNFTGSTVGVFALRRPVAGTLSASYRLDNGAPETVVHFNGSQAIQDRWSVNQAFFTKDLVPSTHSLTVTVTEVTGSQEFVFDYLTFEATSNTRFSGPPPSTITSTSNRSDSSGSRLNIGAIVGSIIAFMLVAYVVRWIFRQRAVYTPQAAPSNNQTYHLETTQVTTTYTQPYSGQQAYEGNAYRQDSWQPPPPPYVPPAQQQAPLQPQSSGWQPPPAPPPMPTPQPWQSHAAGEVAIPEPAVWHQPHSVPNNTNNVNAQPQIGGSPTGPAPPPLPSLSPLSPQPPPPAAAVLHPRALPPPRSPPPQAQQDGVRSESPELEEVPLEQLGLAPNPPNPPPPSNATITTRPNEPGGGPPPPSGNSPAQSGGGGSPGQNPGPRSSSGGPPAYSG